MEKINIQVGQENIAGIILRNNPEMKPNFVFFHGGGNSSKDRVFTFSNALIENNFSIMAIDFSGHGESTGLLTESNLDKRVNQARVAVEKYCDLSNLTICGASMGGYIALKMLELFVVKNLVLFCPAIYSKTALNVQFNQGFTEIIRQPDSWKDSDILDFLEKFSGNLLIVIGEDDEVIPEGVIELLDKHSLNTNKKEIIKIPNCSHQILFWLKQHPEIANRISEKIMEFIK